MASKAAVRTPGKGTGQQVALVKAALRASHAAYAPYSNYQVGAAVLCRDGTVFVGCNVENAAYPQSTCAEASAIVMMIAAGEREIAEVLTVCDGEIIGTCCGGCRQRIREFADLDTPIYACGPDGMRAVFTLEGLLPHSFGPEHLLP